MARASAAAIVAPVEQSPSRAAKSIQPAAEVLLGGLPSGIRPGELSWEALSWERETESFLRRGRLQCRAWFQAQIEDGNTMFLDFQLKGAVTK